MSTALPLLPRGELLLKPAGCWAGIKGCQVGGQGHCFLHEVGLAAIQQGWQQAADLNI